MKKIVLKSLIITFIISAILGISIILLDLWNDVTEKIWLSTITIFSFSIPGLACSTSYEKVKSKVFSMIGIITCFTGCIYYLLLVWDFFNLDFFEDLTLKFALISVLLSLSFGHICLLLLINSSDKPVNYLKRGTITLSIIIDIILLVEIFNEFTEIDSLWKLMLIIAILIVLGTIVTPLLNKLRSKSELEQGNIEDDKYKKLEQIKILLDRSAISEEEYEREKNKILNS